MRLFLVLFSFPFTLTLRPPFCTPPLSRSFPFIHPFQTSCNHSLIHLFPRIRVGKITSLSKLKNRIFLFQPGFFFFLYIFHFSFTYSFRTSRHLNHTDPASYPSFRSWMLDRDFFSICVIGFEEDLASGIFAER